MKYTINNKFIGEYNQTTNIFYKKATESLHLFRKYDAWGIDRGVADDLLHNGATICVKDEERNIVYITSAQVLFELGISGSYDNHGKQIFLERKYWGVL